MLNLPPPPIRLDRPNIWKTENGIPKFNWPAQSPDLNLIVKISRWIRTKLPREIDTIENRSDLMKAVSPIWNGLTHFLHVIYWFSLHGNDVSHVCCNIYFWPLSVVHFQGKVLNSSFIDSSFV